MIEVREAVQKDFTTITHLIQNELGYPDVDANKLNSRLDSFRTDEDWETFVAVLNNEVVGFIGVMKNRAYEIDRYYAQIMALAVSEKTRRIGVGTALLEKVEEWVRSF